MKRRPVVIRFLVRLLVAGGFLLLPARPLLGQAPPTSQIGLVAVAWQDLDGDHDRFPDSGESGRLVLTFRNGQFPLAGVSVVLTSSDADVECIPEYRVAIGDLAPGEVVEVGSLEPGPPGFSLKAAATLASTSGANPARIDLCIRLKLDADPLMSHPLCFFLPADLDLSGGGAPAFIPGPDGLPGTGDDGTLLESFDSDRNGDGLFTVHDTFRMLDAGTGLAEHGAFLRAVGTPGPSVLSAVICGGFDIMDEQDCHLDPDYPMDWHIHCPPGAGNCPNLESGPCNDPLPGGPCTYATPADGQKAASPPNSLHMGVHFGGLDSTRDTTRFRSIQGYRSGPINLTPLPRPGDLRASMFQIADLMDAAGVNATDPLPCTDCGGVQVQVDRAAAPGVDDWGPWENLVPFENVYDHMPSAWSYFGATYCQYTPTDTGTASPAPNGFHETLCFPHGAWSSCGSVRGTTPGSVTGCEGPGVVDPSGTGVWVETKFDLSASLGQRVRLRWIAEIWCFDQFTPHYAAVGGTWETSLEDDGWWVDDVRVAGVIAAQSSPAPDTRPAAQGSCPAVCLDLDGDGYGTPGSPVCPAGPGADCNDLRADYYPGAPEICDQRDSDCDGALSPQEVDDDHDGRTECSGDCNDQDPTIRPGIAERNDGQDNQCPGDRGYGLVDELTGPIAWIPSSPRITWNSQQLATSYQLVRSSRVDFASDCTLFTQPAPPFDDPDVPPAVGGIFYYLARASAPHVGSWGRGTLGVERAVPCVP